MAFDSRACNEACCIAGFHAFTCLDRCFEELTEKNLLRSDARALCVGPKSASSVSILRRLGFSDAVGVERRPFFSLFERRFVYELDFEDGHFDFVFSEDIDRLSVPALLVLEIERVLRPGGTGAVLVRARGPYLNGLVISSFLKSSDIVHVCSLGSFTLVIFKKRLEGFTSFEHFRLPTNCPSVINNEAYMKYIEPITEPARSELYYPTKFPSNFPSVENSMAYVKHIKTIGAGIIKGPTLSELSYLPNFMNISSRNKLVYINVGAGEYTKSSFEKMMKLYRHTPFEVFIVDHKTSVLSTYVTDPGINFVYDPTLTGENDRPDITTSDEDEEAFDFVSWFKETVSDGDFVVLMMKAESMELKILVEMFESGEICHVDELFLHCSDGDCVNLVKSLRKSGVYVHQWMADY